MSDFKDIPWRVVGAFDTETTKVEVDGAPRSFACLYIVEDISHTAGVRYYSPSEARMSFLRSEREMISKIEEWVAFGKRAQFIPVVCAYNLAFDIAGIIHTLAGLYKIEVTAKSGTNIYTLDLVDADGFTVIRMWDVYHLETGGLAAMGRACGIQKLYGDWDYTLIRGLETPLTDKEIEYAAHDTHIILQYISSLLHKNPWIMDDDLSRKVITKTSIVRQFAIYQVGGLKPPGQKKSLLTLHEGLCHRELPASWISYGLRKACFRGGLTFTSARYAFEPFGNVHALDEVSGHHLFINGRFLPVRFSPLYPQAARFFVDKVLETGLDEVLGNFARPFDVAFHARIRFTNLRLKGAFAHHDIGILAEAKFTATAPVIDYEENEAEAFKIEALKGQGWRDKVKHGRFAFGKLVSAAEATVFVNEIELWNMAQVYEWDGLEVELAEGSTQVEPPPDYISLQSNMLYNVKQRAKEKALSGDTADLDWYNGTLKGMFNSIFGTQAQDLLRPRFHVVDEEIKVNEESIPSKDSYKELIEGIHHARSVYNYGIRIAAGSRQYLIIAIMLLWEEIGEAAKVLGGDTDSLYIQYDGQKEDILQALEPLHDAADMAISEAQARVRRQYPQYASTFDRLGHFEHQDTYSAHIEMWNKARVSVKDEEIKLTMAGVPRPRGGVSIIGAISQEYLAAEGTPPERLHAATTKLLGLNIILSERVSNSLEHYRPHPSSRVRTTITDYLGQVEEIDAPEVVSLVENTLVIGDEERLPNMQNRDYLVTKYGRKIPDTLRYVDYKDGLYTVENVI